MKLTNYERFEILAEAFRVMTGHMAPGKDASMLSYPAPYEERRAAWDAWNAQHLDVVRAVLTASERVIQREEDGVTVLPDGSAFAVGSLPLPKDHWLYAPRGEWDSERDEFAECPRPILTNAQRDAVIAAARYAIRGATMCGQEPDFDPDALALNFAYALCGPAGGALLHADAG